MALSKLQPATERDLYWEWLRAELDVPHEGPRSERHTVHGLEPRLLSILERGDRAALRESEWGDLRTAFRRLRGDYLEPLLDGSTIWKYGDLQVAELAEIRIPNLTISLVPVAPTRLLAEYAAAMDAGRETPGLPNLGVYRALRRGFETGRSRGCLVLIAELPAGPYVLAEGLTRASVLVSRRRQGESVPSVLRVLLGVTPRVREWSWW